MNSLTISSSREDVQNFLSTKDFNKEIINKFIKYDGQDLLGASIDSLIRKCGDDEGERLYG